MKLIKAKSIIINGFHELEKISLPKLKEVETITITCHPSYIPANLYKSSLSEINMDNLPLLENGKISIVGCVNLTKEKCHLGPNSCDAFITE